MTLKCQRGYVEGGLAMTLGDIILKYKRNLMIAAHFVGARALSVGGVSVEGGTLKVHLRAGVYLYESDKELDDDFHESMHHSCADTDVTWTMTRAEEKSIVNDKVVLIKVNEWVYD